MERFNVGVMFTDGETRYFDTCEEPEYDEDSLYFTHCANLKEFGLGVTWVKVYIPIAKVRYWFEEKKNGD